MQLSETHRTLVMDFVALGCPLLDTTFKCALHLPRTQCNMILVTM